MKILKLEHSLMELYIVYLDMKKLGFTLKKKLIFTLNYNLYCKIVSKDSKSK
jgi:hypothetical protein